MDGEHWRVLIRGTFESVDCISVCTTVSNIQINYVKSGFFEIFLPEKSMKVKRFREISSVKFYLIFFWNESGKELTHEVPNALR